MWRGPFFLLFAASAAWGQTQFDGTSGVGVGPLSLRPQTCCHRPTPLAGGCQTGLIDEDGAAGGVGYFATDVGPQGTLYRCAADNIWIEHYRPYTYPHPLVTGTVDPPPPPPPPPPPGCVKNSKSKHCR